MTKKSFYYLYYQGYQLGLISSDIYKEDGFSISADSSQPKQFKAVFSDGMNYQFSLHPKYSKAQVVKVDYDEETKLAVGKEVVKEFDLKSIAKN